MSRLTRDGTAEPVSRDQILRHALGQGNIHFPCSADHEQDWQPYPLSILPESEYEIEKRTFCYGLQPDREQVLMAIRSRYENFQRQRKKGGGRKDAGNAFVADAGGRHGGKNHSSSSARGRGKRRWGACRITSLNLYSGRRGSNARLELRACRMHRWPGWRQ